MTISSAPILIVDWGRLLFVGPVDEVPAHTAMVPIFGAGLDGDFEFTPKGEAPVVTRAHVVPAGVNRTVRAYGRRLAVMPIDPVQANVRLLSAAAAIEATKVLATEFNADAWRALGEALGIREPLAPTTSALLRATEFLVGSLAHNLPVAEVARRAGMSVSRLQRLFRRELGTSIRGFRIWRRFWALTLAMRGGASLTEAAVEVGFFDSAHFTKTFRRTFGVAPSWVFSPTLRIHVVPLRD